MPTIAGVPVFREGVHHAREYSRSEVALMARAARWTGESIPLRLGGHGPTYPAVGSATNFRVDMEGMLVCDLALDDAAVARMRAERLVQPSIGHAFTSALCCEAVTEVALVARGDVDLPPIALPEDDAEVAVGGTA